MTPSLSLSLAIKPLVWLFVCIKVLVINVLMASVNANGSDLVEGGFSDREKALLQSFGPWPPAPQADPSNHLSGIPQAIAWGQQLFADKGLSANGEFSCRSCHQPEYAFTDRLALARSATGTPALIRNTPSLFNLQQQRWFGWGGESDSIWSHSIRPLLSAQEMAGSAQTVKNYITERKDYRAVYQSLFQALPDNHSDEQVLVNVAKALGAYQETLISPRTDFDKFRDAMVADNVSASAYPLAAQRGLKLFMGKANCHLCHLGPQFSNGEFADIGIPFFATDGVDSGRYQGIRDVKNSPYNRLGIYSDTQNPQHQQSTRYVQLKHNNWGEFKVPSLRGVSQTAPYMHNGSLPDLSAVIHYYNTIDEARLHADGEQILKPLDLTPMEQKDLLAFLESL